MRETLCKERPLRVWFRNRDNTAEIDYRARTNLAGTAHCLMYTAVDVCWRKAGGVADIPEDRSDF